MAKSNGQLGAVVSYATIPVNYDGEVLSVTKIGVSITTRAFGKQTMVDRFFSAADIVAHSDVGPGFVVVNESRAVTSYHGDVVVEDNKITVTLENGTVLSFLPNTTGVRTQVHFDTDDSKQTSTEANIAKRNSSKLVTLIGRIEEKSGGKKVKKSKKTK